MFILDEVSRAIFQKFEVYISMLTCTVINYFHNLLYLKLSVTIDINSVQYINFLSKSCSLWWYNQYNLKVNVLYLIQGHNKSIVSSLVKGNPSNIVNTSKQ